MPEKNLKTILVDGINVEMTDTAAEVVNKTIRTLQDQLAALTTKSTADATAAAGAKQTLDGQIATLTTQAQAKDAEIVTLKKQAEDGKLTPAKLDQLVKDRSEVVVKARAKIGDKLVVDGKTTAEMQRQVVDATLGDAAKGWTDEQVNISFATMTADVRADQPNSADVMARSFQGKPPTSVADRQKPYDAYDKRLESAWKGEQPITRQ